MREKYETLSLATLKELAKGRGMRGISTLKKGELIEAMLLQDEKDTANKDIAATPSVTRREKATVVRGRRPSASEQEKAKAGCRDCAGSGKGGNSRNVRRKRYRIRGGQTGAAATDEWQSVRGDTQHPDIRQPYLEQSGKTVNATPRPENAPERGEETACSRDGRMWRVHSRMQIAPSSQESEGCSGTIPSAAIMQGQAVRARFLRWPQMKSIPVKLLSQNRV